MKHGTVYPILDRLVDGQLASLLKEWQGQGLSQMDVRDRIRDVYGVSVSQATVSRWYRRLRDEPAERAS